MMNKMWCEATEKEIRRLLECKPSNERAMLLASLISIQKHLKHHIPMKEESGSELMTHLGEELDGAEWYLQLWHDTGNADFKAIAREELRHFDTLAKYVKQQEPGADLSGCITRHTALMAKLV